MTTYFKPKKFDPNWFYGEHLNLINHTEKSICDLGKILGGGIYCDQRLSDYSIFNNDHFTKQDMAAARAYYLLRCANDMVELDISQSERCMQVLDSNYHSLSIADINNGSWNRSREYLECQYQKPYSFSIQTFFETPFLIANNDAQILCEIGRPYTSSQNQNDTEYLDQDIIDSISFFLLQSIGDKIQFILQDQPIYADLVSAGYRTISIDFLNTHYRNTDMCGKHGKVQ